MSKPADRILFGLKVRQLRLELGLSFAELASRAGLSASYINEIEKGKKSPRTDSVLTLAKALSVDPDWLAGDDPGPHLAPVAALLRSNFLQELPLELFGIEPGRVVELLASAPIQVNAFVVSLVELAQNHAVGENHFYLSAMRAYQELHSNYFPELEAAAMECRSKFDLPLTGPVPLSGLKRILINAFGVKLVPDGIRAWPDLDHLRSMYIPARKELLLHPRLTNAQLAFQLAKEIGFHILGLDPRPLTSTLVTVNSFQEVLHNFKAGYFAVALLIDERAFLERIGTSLSGSFQHQDMVSWLGEYGVSPDVLFQRFNVITGHWGLDQVFYHRLVFRTSDQRYHLDKELHLHREGRRYAGRQDEEYCRRWLSSRLIREVAASGSDAPRTGISRVRFAGSEDTYICLGMASGSTFRPGTYPGIMMGVKLDPQSRPHFRFLDGLDLPLEEINLTCERCGLEDCQLRAAPPVRLEGQRRRQAVRDLVRSITG